MRAWLSQHEIVFGILTAAGAQIAMCLVNWWIREEVRGMKREILSWLKDNDDGR